MEVKKGNYTLIVEDKPSPYSGTYGGFLYRKDVLIIAITYGKKLTKKEMGEYLDFYVKNDKDE